ncbi:MAG: DUF6660 family protein [Chitinophagales bacterium]
MKYLSIILSFFLLTLSVLPCTDVYACEENNMMESHMSHDHSENEQDHCPPFCLCSCCGITFTTENLQVSCETAPPVQNQGYSFFYSFNYVFSFISNIWHPPAL